jgi:protein-L-isoaspartate(D-aspartate) O-methyltransferase
MAWTGARRQISGFFHFHRCLAVSSASNNDEFVTKLVRAGVISSEAVESVMRRVDRGHYVLRNAYVDSPQSIGHGVTISAPHMHAMCLQLLQDRLATGKRALDVGVGSGYLAACMAEMVGPSGRVIGIDVIEPLVEQCRRNLQADGRHELAQLSVHVKDGWKGDPDNAPFDAIHVGAAAATTPPALVEQLALGGRLIIPVGPEGGHQVLMQYDRDPDGNVTSQVICGVRYVPLVRQQSE